MLLGLQYKHPLPTDVSRRFFQDAVENSCTSASCGAWLWPATTEYTADDAVPMLAARRGTFGPSGQSRFGTVTASSSDRGRKLLQYLHGPGIARPPRRLHMHQLYLLRGLFELLDRRYVLPSP